MNELRIFNYNGSEVRTVEQDGEPWFVLKDVCDVLALSNPSVVAARLEEDERAKFDLGRQGDATIINEPGLYNVILRSDKPQAKAFKRWVTHEVLPTIRKHGVYMTPETLEAAILNPDTMIRLCTALKDERDKRIALEFAHSALSARAQIMQPKADYFDELVDRNLLTGLRETAKQLDVPPKAFAQFLLENHFLYRDQKGKLMPYAQHVQDGVFAIKECVCEKTNWAGTQTLVTPKGRETFRLLSTHIA